MTDKEKLEAVTAAKRDLEAELARIHAQMPDRTPEEVTLDTMILNAIANRCKHTVFKSLLEELILALLKDGKLFNLRHFKLVLAVLDHLRAAAQKEDAEGIDKFLGRQRWAQNELASISALFIRAKVLSDAVAVPWLANAAKWEHFKKRWAEVRRLKKPHERVQFEFTYERMALFDSQVSRLLSGPLKNPELGFPPPRSAAAVLLEEIKRDHPHMIRALNMLLDRIEEIQATSTGRLGTPWGYAWTIELRQARPAECPDYYLPYLEEEWELFKKRQELDLKRHAWSLVKKGIRNCAVTLLEEFRCPPVNLDQRDWIVPKHSVARPI